MADSRHEMRSDRGFTLIEVMTALLILSIGLLGVGTMIVSSMQNEGYNSHVRIAEYLASAKMEELRGDTAYSTSGQLTPNTGEGKYLHYNNKTGRFTESDTLGEGDVYVRRIMVGSPDTENAMAVVRVTVGWPCGDATSRCSPNDVSECTYKYRMSATFLQKP